MPSSRQSKTNAGFPRFRLINCWKKRLLAPEGQGIRDDNIRYFLYDQIKNDKWVYYNEKEEGHGENEAFRTLDIEMIQSAKDTLGDIKVTALLGIPKR